MKSIIMTKTIIMTRLVIIKMDDVDDVHTATSYITVLATSAPRESVASNKNKSNQLIHMVDQVDPRPPLCSTLACFALSFLSLSLYIRLLRGETDHVEVARRDGSGGTYMDRQTTWHELDRRMDS